MCTGSGYTLRCDHELIHFTTRCPKECTTLSPDFLEDLDDICAVCQNRYNFESLGRTHAILLSQMKDQLAVAKEKGDQGVIRAIKTQIQQLSKTREADMKRAHELRWAFSDVKWPGKQPADWE